MKSDSQLEIEAVRRALDKMHHMTVDDKQKYIEVLLKNFTFSETSIKRLKKAAGL